MSNVDPPTGSSGLTEKEAKEFHNIFVTNLIFFVGVAIVAHLLVWQWRPWLPGVQGYASATTEQVKTTVAKVTPYIFTA
jgi:light-harvesting complex 1 beta chain